LGLFKKKKKNKAKDSSKPKKTSEKNEFAPKKEPVEVNQEKQVFSEDGKTVVIEKEEQKFEISEPPAFSSGQKPQIAEPYEEEIVAQPQRVETFKPVEEFATDDLMHRMQKFYGQERSKAQTANPEVKGSIISKMQELKDLENQWSEWNKRSKEMYNTIKGPENEIKTKIQDLRGLLKTLKSGKYKQVTQEEFFYCSNGQAFKNLTDLLNGLLHMSDHSFRIHVSTGKNDFANWIAHVFHDYPLADLLKTVDSREDMVKILNEKVKILNY